MTNHNSPCIFEEVAWISRKRVEKYGGRCAGKNVEEWEVFGLQDSTSINRTPCDLSLNQERCFRESSNWFWKVCNISGFIRRPGFVYCVFLCENNKLEPKKPDALAGYSMCTCTAALFLPWEPQTSFIPQNDTFTDRGTK